MKDVLSLTKAITEVEYYSDMFEKWGEDKNILFVSPQLSGRHLYKTILPFFCLSSQDVATAITSLKRYDYKKQLLDFQIDLNDEMVDWADIIIFPFTTQPLVEEIYTRIREIKPEAKIFFSVDFNFYELSKNHPFHEIFSDENIINDVESNMYFADMVLVTNLQLLNYIVEKIQKLQETKFKNVDGYMSICGLPLFIDSKIILKNVDYDTQNTQNVTVVVKKQEPLAASTPATTNATESTNAITKENKPSEVVHSEGVKSLIEKTEMAGEKVKVKELQKKEQAAKQKDENFKKHQEQKIKKQKEKPKAKAKNIKVKNDKKPIKNGKHTSATATEKTSRKPKPSAKSATGKGKRGIGAKKRS
jgi:hypothetical protein